MKSEGFLRGSTLAVIFAIPFVPLVVLSGYFFPFVTGKNFVFRGLVEVMMLLWLVLAIFNASYRPKKTWVFLSYSFFIFVLGLSTFFSVDPYNSFWSNFERMEGLVTHLHLFGYFLVLVSVMKTEKLWKWFFSTSIGVSLLISLYAFGQFIGAIKIFQSSDRLESTLGNSAYLATYLLFHIFLIGYYLVRGEIKNLYIRIFYWIILLFETTILFYTETRGAIVGLFSGVFLIALLGVVKGEGRLKKIGIILTGTLVVLSGVFFSIKDREFVTETRGLRRFSNITLLNRDVQARFMVWKIALQGVRERPILGWGLENFSVVFNKYYDPSLYDREPWFDRAHNVFLDWLTSAGVLGLLAYLSLFGSAVYCLIFDTTSKISFTARSVLVGVLGSYFVQNIFVFDNITSYIIFVSILAYTHHLHKESLWIQAKEVFEIAWDRFAFRKNIKVRLSLSAIVVVVFATTFYGFVIAPASNAKDLIIAITSITSEKNVEQSLGVFNRILKKNITGLGEAREQFLRMAISVSQFSDSDKEIINHYLDTATRQMHLQTEEHLYDTRARLFLGAFYNLFGQYDVALTYLDDAQELSPRKQNIHLERAIVYTKKGDTQKAEAVLREAYQLEEKNPDIVLAYAKILLDRENNDEAKRVLVKHFGDAKAQQLLTSPEL